jgi:hypothetical protein
MFDRLCSLSPFAPFIKKGPIRSVAGRPLTRSEARPTANALLDQQTGAAPELASSHWGQK